MKCQQGIEASGVVKRTVKPPGAARKAEAAAKFTPTGQSSRLNGGSSLAR